VNGQRKWSSTVEILDETSKNEISDAVLAEFEKLAPSRSETAARW
jgi:hypothetical protein